MLQLSRKVFVNLLLGAAALAGCSGSSTESGSRVSAGMSCVQDGARASSVDGCNTCECRMGEWSCSEVDCTASCVDGQRRDDGCNVCVCNAGAWSCTASTCVSEGCADGEVSSDGCNSCSCSNGTWQCTDVACPETCSEGDTRSAGDGCNTCSCVEGEWACTLLDCAPPECIDGETTSDSCSVCVCQAGTWQCSGAACEPICPPPTTREPGLGCTTVVVYARDPSSGMCCEYGDPCGAPAGWEQFYSLDECQGTAACVPGEVMPAGDGCNTCTCDAAGTWLCTLMPCVAECVRGQTRRDADGCNTCTCTTDGAWACTDMACSGEPVACGGWLGDTCTDDEYCAYTEGQMCGAADASATCAPRPSACDLNFAPVCGCDGQTYSNDCAAASAGTGVYSSGECISTR